MKLDIIDFCNGKAFVLKNDIDKKNILDMLDTKYDIKILTKHYESTNKRIESNEEYMIYVRSNGNPYYLLFTTYKDNKMCIFIDKKIKKGFIYPRIVITHYSFFFDKDTVFEGEMIKNTDEKWVFIINDILVKDSELITMDAIPRIELMNTYINNNYKHTRMAPCNLYTKRFFHIKDFNELNYINSLSYTCRGLYYRPLKYKKLDTLYNFDNSLIVQEKHVVTAASNHKFKVSKTTYPDVYDVYENDAIVGIACIPTMKIHKYMKELFENKSLVEKVPLNMVLSKKFGSWIPVLNTS